MPRYEVVADFHCVAGWSATGLRWERVPFAALHREVLAPRAAGSVTHVKFVGSDGYWSVALLEDVLDDDVLLAEHLDGRRLDGITGRRCDWSARVSTDSSTRSTCVGSSC